MTDTPLTIFISYSHDSPDHKRWVAELATRLMANGVNVLLDQWELRFGDDVPKFMERSVQEADRVLMVCTEPYVRKADEGEGGVGYEAMIVTASLIKDLGTAKFIPVIRQNTVPRQRPVSLSTRMYLDFSDDAQFEQSLTELLSDLHQPPNAKKPPLGKRPGPGVKPESRREPTDPLPTPLDTLGSTGDEISSIYRKALTLAQADDLVGWRALVKEVRPKVMKQLTEWRTKTETALPATAGEFVPIAKEAVGTYAPLLAIAVAGVESANPKFNQQKAILDDILYPKNWVRAGRTIVIELPTTIAYVYQGLYGAVCMSTNQPSLGLSMIRSHVHFPDWNERIEMWKNHGVMGWANGFEGKATTSWNQLAKLGEEWIWLTDVFGDSDEYRAALTAYYMYLNVFEYVEALRSLPIEQINPKTLRLEIPICYESESDDVKRRAYSILISSAPFVRQLWTSAGIADATVLEHWDKWTSVCSEFVEKVYSPFWRANLANRNVVADVLRECGA